MTKRAWYLPRRAFITLVVAVGGLFVVLAVILRVAINAVSFPPTGTSSIGDYPTVLSEWSATGLVGHFPATIPAGATNVRFFSEPKFLQGGGYVWVRLRLPASEIAAIEARARGATTRAYAPGDRADRSARMADTIGGINTASLAGHTLYLLTVPDRGMGTWNHGRTAGIAVFREANEVLYWAEDW